MTQTPAGWYADPQDQAQYRYFDGAAWTEHRAPRSEAPSTVAAAGQELAEGVADAFTSLGGWVQQQVASTPGHPPAQPTFASLAASCRDEPQRHPLSEFVELSLPPLALDGVRELFAFTRVEITPDGVELANEACRLVPNPWDPADPTGVAVLIGTMQVGRLPADVAAAYCPGLTQLTQKHLLATGVATVRARGSQVPESAQVTVSIPPAAAFGA